MHLHFRYPGVAPFSATQRDLFFGRDEVCQDLIRFVQAEQLTVLYGKSGLGKSSLINAGVVPVLTHDHGYQAVYVRFGNWTPDQQLAPLDILEATLKRATAGMPVPAPLAPLLDDADSLAPADLIWLMVRQLQGEAVAPVLLIFDQFEEVFTYPQGVGVFGRAIAALLNNATPRALRGRLEAAQMAEPLRVKVLMSIRADRMSLLNGLAPALPSVLRNLYQLMPFTQEQAKEAILLPACAVAKDGEAPFASAPFGYTDTALGAILGYLADAKGYIEGAQLQLVCRHCELKYSGKAPQHPLPEISVADLGDLRTISRSYYDSVVDECPADRREAVRDLVERHLVDSDNRRRITAHEATIARLGINDLLPKLENSHLVRREPASTGGYTYELSHDTLVEPILQALAEREAERARVAALTRRREEEARLAAEAAKLAADHRRSRRIALAGGALLLLALVGIGVGVWQGWRASVAQSTALKSQSDAVVLQAKAKTLKQEADAAQTDALRLKAIADAAQQQAQVAQTEAKISLHQAKEAQSAAVMAKQNAMQAQIHADSMAAEAQRALVDVQRAILEPHFDNARHTILDGYEVGNDFYTMDSLVHKALEVDAKLAFPLNKYVAEMVYAGSAADNKNSATALLKAANARRAIPRALGSLATAAQVHTAMREVLALNQSFMDTLARRYPIEIPTMTPIPGGSFAMGSPDGEGENDEHPQHTVTLNAFSLGETEVTQRQWQSVMGKNPSYFQNCPDCPVETVSWNDIQVYLSNLRVLTGKIYRLPTEAEWEYAAREGGKNVRFGNGKDIANPAEINFDGREVNKQPYSVVGQFWAKTTPVKTFAPNGLGLYDMSGNVWEWCLHGYGMYGKDAVTNPLGPASDAERVIRGGSWRGDPARVRATRRSSGNPGGQSDGLGFRLAKAGE